MPQFGGLDFDQVTCVVRRKEHRIASLQLDCPDESLEKAVARIRSIAKSYKIALPELTEWSMVPGGSRSKYEHIGRNEVVEVALSVRVSYDTAAPYCCALVITFLN